MHLLRFLTTERLVFVIYLVILAGFVSAFNADTFLHLAAGRYIVETGSLPHRDVFSFSAEGQPWVMHEWLYQALTFLVHEAAGMSGLKLLTGLACMLTLYITKKSADLLTEVSWVKWLVLGLLLILMGRFISPRPVLVTMVLFTFYFYALLAYRCGNKQRILYWLPPLMILWVNSHGGFIVGLVLIGYFAFLHVVDTRIRQGRWECPRVLAVTLLLCVAASTLNPYGYQQLFFPFQLMNEWSVGQAEEWRPPDFSNGYNLVFLLTVIVFLLAVIMGRSKERMSAAALALPFVIAAFFSVRHVLLAALIMAPYLTLMLPELFNAWKGPLVRFAPGLPTLHQVAEKKELGDKENVFNLVVLMLFLISLYLVYPWHRQWVVAQAMQLYPVEATRYLQMNEIEGRLFSPMEYSDYILFAAYPRIKVFYDVRLEIYGEQLTRDYITMNNAGGGWQELFRKHDINVVVTKASGRLFAAMSVAAAYSKVYEDGASAIFLPNAGALPASHQLRHPGILHQ